MFNRETVFSYRYEYLNILHAITNFYILEELSNERPCVNLIHRNQFAKLKYEIFWLHNNLMKKMGRTLFDYLSSICLGEARHYRGHCSDIGLETNKVGIPSNRNSVYSNAHKYFPPQFLPVLIDLFMYGRWSNGYGGPKWGQIAKVANLYKKVPDKVFIDHCIDLAHNNGTVFSKPLMVTLGGRHELFRLVLDVKFRGSLLSYLYEDDIYTYNKLYPHIRIEPAVYDCMKLMAQFQGKIIPSHFHTDQLCFPPPIVWLNRTNEIFLSTDLNIRELKKKQAVQPLYESNTVEDKVAKLLYKVQSILDFVIVSEIETKEGEIDE